MEIAVLALIATVVFVCILFALDDSPLDEIRYVLAFCITGLAVIRLSQTGSDFLGILLIPSAALALTLLTLPFVSLIWRICRKIMGLVICVVIHDEMHAEEKQPIAESASRRKRRSVEQRIETRNLRTFDHATKD